MTIRMRVRLALGLLAAIAVAACASQPTASVHPSPPEASGYTDVAPVQLAEMLTAKDFTFVNVHIPYDGEIEQTDAFLPFDDVDGLRAALPDPDAKIVLYCRSGSMSTTAAQALVEAGYTNVWELDGGMNAWRAEGYTLVGGT